jgi:hypothetical protein
MGSNVRCYAGGGVLAVLNCRGRERRKSGVGTGECRNVSGPDDPTLILPARPETLFPGQRRLDATCPDNRP